MELRGRSSALVLLGLVLAAAIVAVGLDRLAHRRLGQSKSGSQRSQRGRRVVCIRSLFNEFDISAYPLARRVEDVDSDSPAASGKVDEGALPSR